MYLFSDVLSTYLAKYRPKYKPRYPQSTESWVSNSKHSIYESLGSEAHLTIIAKVSIVPNSNFYI